MITSISSSPKARTRGRRAVEGKLGTRLLVGGLLCAIFGHPGYCAGGIGYRGGVAWYSYRCTRCTEIYL